MSDKTEGVLAVLADIWSLGLIGDNVFAFEDARAKVAELLAAVIESREATQAFANDGQPENWARYEASEARIENAIRAMRGEPPVG